MIYASVLILNERDLRLMASKSGFAEVFYKASKHYKTYEQCYEALEEIYQIQYFERKYSSYQSFRQTIRRSLKQKKYL